MLSTVYARVSTLDQASSEKISIPDQIKWAEEFSESRGWKFTKPYIEKGVFGDIELENRPAMSALLQDAKDKKFDLVLVYHSSRFAREVDVGMKGCRVLGQMGIQVYFRNAPIEPSSNFYWGSNVGSQYMTAFSFIGDFQENIARSERTRSGSVGLAKRGIMRTAPFAYVKIPKVLTDENGKQKYLWNYEVDPLKAEIVKNIFNLYEQGTSLRSIMLRLNRSNTSSPSGKVGLEAWTPATIKNILSNPTYCGFLRWGRKLGSKFIQGKTQSGKSKRVFVTPDKWILVKGENFVGFIEEKQFQTVNNKLKERYLVGGRAISSPGLLSGRVVCGRCNRKAYFKTRYITKKNKHKPNKRYLRSDYVCQSWTRFKTCNRHIMAGKKLHQLVLDELFKVSGNFEYRSKLLNTYTPKNNKVNIQALEGLKKTVDQKQKRLIEGYEAGALSLKLFSERKKIADKEQNDILEKLQLAKNTKLQKQNYNEGRKKFISNLNKFSKDFETLDFTRKKELLGNLISSVIVGDNVHINFKI